MAAITGAAIVAAGTAYAANRQASAAKKGAAAQHSAANAAIADQASARQEYRDLNQPYIDAGSSALGLIDRINRGDMTAFQESPDFQFRLGQGQDALLRAASSRGAVNSGGLDLDLIDYGQGAAAGEFGNWYQRQLAQAQLGQSSAAGAGGAAIQTAGAIGGLRQDAANAAAGGYAGQANAQSNLVSQLGQLAGQYAQNYGGGRGSSYGGAGSNYNFGNNSPGALGSGRPYNFGG